MMTKNKTNKKTFARECLTDALKILLREKRIEDISVSELVRTAGCSRTTFYRNYTAITDILEDFFDRFPFGAIEPGEYTQDGFELRKRLERSFTFLKENAELMEAMLANNLILILYRNYDRLMKGPFSQRLYELGFRTEYEQTAAAGIYFSLCYEWIRGGYRESVPEMVDLTYRILHKFYINDENALPERDNIYLPLAKQKK